MKDIGLKSIVVNTNTDINNVFKVTIMYANYSGIICKISKKDLVNLYAIIDNKYVEAECEVVDFKSTEIYVKLDKEIIKVPLENIVYIYNNSIKNYNYTIKKEGIIDVPDVEIPDISDDPSSIEGKEALYVVGTGDGHQVVVTDATNKIAYIKSLVAKKGISIKETTRTLEISTDNEDLENDIKAINKDVEALKESVKNIGSSVENMEKIETTSSDSEKSVTINGITIKVSTDETGKEKITINDKDISEGTTGGSGASEADVMIDWSEDPTTTDFHNLPTGSKFKGTVTELLYEITHPFIYPSISVSCEESTGTYESGSTKTLTSIILSSNGGSKGAFTENDPVIYINNTPIQLDENDEVLKTDDSYLVEFATPKEITANTTIKASVVIKGKTIQNSASYVFILPSYYGSIEDKTKLTADKIVANSTKLMKNKGTLSLNYTCESAYTYICYPKSWGTVKKITDPNGFDITSSHTTSEVTINGNAYYLLCTNDYSSIEDFKITFGF